MKKIRSTLYKSMLFALCVALATVTVAFAASGGLDPTFSGDGKITQALGGTGSRAWDVAVQADGKVVTLGKKYLSGGAADFAIVRYNTDGSLDATFSGDGRQFISFGHTDDGLSVVIQTDGKIVVGGQTCTSGGVCDVALARLNTNGSLDTTFSGDGKVVQDFGGDDNGGNDIALNGSKIVVAGYEFRGGDYDGAIYQFTASGAVDTTFAGGDGAYYIASSDYEFLRSIVVSGGKIYAVGEVTPPDDSTADFLTVSINSNGSPNTAFGASGVATTDLGGYDWGRGIIVSGGKPVVVGASDSSFVIMRYAANGNLDTTFSGDGVIMETLGYAAPNFRSVTFQGTKIVVGGATDYFGVGDTLMLRYTAAGNLDTTFGVGGKVKTNWGGTDMWTSVLFKNNRIYAVGGSYTTAHRFIVGAYLP
jgi:uncharacterized delta-60 repeat protein